MGCGSPATASTNARVDRVASRNSSAMETAAFLRATATTTAIVTTPITTVTGTCCRMGFATADDCDVASKADYGFVGREEESWNM
jgi:hypothetical protein